ncbi:FAR1-related sequence 5 [Rhynchospora pubera]|uniref:Protein FAR1-RELATED SEQUENCE n=1 Tax=Rhynchospora pubera TaxID=906938 RepID=A0AAV8G156_9POAL|nr:FAR1-related sequence 5 [Rhynchospora pubera]
MSSISNVDEGTKSPSDGDDIDPHEDPEFTPFVGKVFATSDDAFDFYNAYALLKGFSIRRRNNYKSSKLGDVSANLFSCSKEGISKKEKDARKAREEGAHERTPQKDRASSRTGCKARLRITFLDEAWKVTVFDDVHNHPLVISPSKVRSLHSHRSMSPEVVDTIKGMYAQNIETAKIHEYLKVRNGAKRSLKFKRKDVSNVIASENRRLVGIDVESSLVYFQKKKEEDAEFFYDVEIDKSGRLKNMFWVDGRARRAFQEFGDVVTFDTTFQTNKFSMPVAPFIGVNHHRMSIIFGIAMLRSEETTSFIWLFETWVKAMYGKKPQVIITDQDAAMRIAIKVVFPNAVHRCCQWHMMRKAREHLGILYNSKKGFEDDLKRVINRSMTVSDFEEGWRHMLKKHKLGNNRHLKNMYEKRSEWVPAYFRGTFFADMSTTQRSESANSSLKIWTNNHKSMYQLVLNVEKIVDNIWEKESDEDIASMNVVPKLTSFHRIEKDASQVYTRKVMKLFKEILKESQLGEVDEIEKDALYQVTIKEHPDIKNWILESYMVKINKLEDIVSCSCKGYEFEGLLCSHAIKVMHHVNMFHLPNRYIMKRWCKDANACAKRSKFERSMDIGSTQEQESLRFATLKPRVIKLLNKVSKSSEAFKKFQGLLSMVEQEMQDVVNEEETLTHEVGTLTSTLSQGIIDPPISQCKGKRKRPQRFKPPSEPKKPRKCGICGSKKGGHNARTCPLKKGSGDDIELDDSQEDAEAESDGEYEDSSN